MARIKCNTRSTTRRKYPTYRNVTSMKKPTRPGMQAFNSRNDLQELVHRIRKPPIDHKACNSSEQRIIPQICSGDENEHNATVDFLEDTQLNLPEEYPDSLVSDELIDSACSWTTDTVEAAPPLETLKAPVTKIQDTLALQSLLRKHHSLSHNIINEDDVPSVLRAMVKPRLQELTQEVLQSRHHPNLLPFDSELLETWAEHDTALWDWIIVRVMTYEGPHSLCNSYPWLLLGLRSSNSIDTTIMRKFRDAGLVKLPAGAVQMVLFCLKRCHIVFKEVINYMDYHRRDLPEPSTSPSEYEWPESSNPADFADIGSWKRMQHEVFIEECIKELERARISLQNGDSSLLDLLLSNEIPRKLWETGWKRYLDYLKDHNLMKRMDVFLQNAYVRVGQLEQAMPEFTGLWEACRKGLDEYLTCIHVIRPTAKKGIPPLRDKGGQPTTRVEFRANWARPITELGCRVLKGWSYLRNLVKWSVYVRIGFVFCEVDAW